MLTSLPVKISSYLIENVELWTDTEVVPKARFWVENGRLKALGEEVPADLDVHRVDGRGFVLMPAGVDAQVHLRVPGQSQKETAETGLNAALKGGFAAILTMPNTKPTIDNVEVLKQAQDEVQSHEQETGVSVFWSAAITKHLTSAELTDFESLVRAGVRAFTNDGLGVEPDEVMDGAFKGLQSAGVPLLQHAEFTGHGGSLAPGPVQQKVGAKPYPDEPEWKMVERDLRLLERYPNARYHVLHVSAKKTLELVAKAKKQGLNVTAEVTPHHLYFKCETIGTSTSFKMNPPIRSPEDQQALWQALREGTLDFVATDHAPHEALMKQGSFDDVAFGTLGLETALPVLIYGWKQGWLTSQRLVQVFSTRPAEFLRLPAGFGHIRKGAPFHAVLVDVHAPEHVYQEQDFSSLSKNSCFIGTGLPGKIYGAFHEQRVFNFV